MKKLSKNASENEIIQNEGCYTPCLPCYYHLRPGSCTLINKIYKIRYGKDYDKDLDYKNHAITHSDIYNYLINMKKLKRLKKILS
jgi:hypothetical protein